MSEEYSEELQSGLGECTPDELRTKLRELIESIQE